MIFFIYDKIFDGLLIVLFDVYNCKIFFDVLFLKGDILLFFYDDIFMVIIDEEKVGCVWWGLQKKILVLVFLVIIWCWFLELLEVGMFLF